MHCCPRKEVYSEHHKGKQKKKVEEITERLSRAKSFILTDFQGLTVAEISELRQNMKDAGSEYKVCKNTLFGIALGDAPYKEQLKESLKGCTGVVFGYDDPVLAVKKASSMRKRTKNLN